MAPANKKFTREQLFYLAKTLRTMHANEAIAYPPLNVLADDMARMLIPVTINFDYDRWMKAVVTGIGVDK